MAWSTGYIFSFAAGICVVCSLGVAGASMGLRDLQQANERKAFQQKVLSAVGLPELAEGETPKPMSAEEVDSMFTERLKLVVVDREGKESLTDKTDEEKLAAVEQARAEAKGTDEPPAYNPVYVRKDGDATKAYALELKGKGLWGPISGYLALEPDGKTVMNVAFDAPKETPGLGAEIMNPPFLSRWPGKSISQNGQLRPISVVKGSAALACPGETEHCVDGVSGATITSRGVDSMVEKAIESEYAPYLKKIQAGS